MVNPIYQQGEELMLNPFGSKYLGVAAHTNVNSNEFIVQEDAIISVLTGGDSSIAANDVDYKASMSLSGVTLKQGALIVAPQGESFQSMTIDSGTIMAYNSVLGGTKPSSFVGLLDDYPNAAAAYSLRKLRTDYTGDAIEVRKTVASVTSTQDIGFDSNGDLDTAALLSFVGVGNDGFVSKWYDQSGNGDNASQVSASAQPKIVSSGSVILENGKAAIEFDGSNDFFDAASVTTGDPKSIFISSKFTSVSASEKVIFDSITTNQSILYKGTSNAIALGFGTFTFTSYTATTDYVLYSIMHNGTNSNAYINSGQILTNTNLGTNAFNGLRIAAVRGTASLFYNGIISEFIVYGSDESANRTDIETNINDYYNVY